MAIVNKGNGVQVVDDDDDDDEQDHRSREIGLQFRGGPDNPHVSRKAIEQYGPTEGCPACASTARRGTTIGRAGINHNDRCRERAMVAMRDDPQYRQFMQTHQGSIGTLHDENNNGTKRPTTHKELHRLQQQRGHVGEAMHAVKQQMTKTTHNISSQLDQTMLQTLVAAMDVVEPYSPPRIASMAAKMGLIAGRSLDITTQGTDGRALGILRRQERATEQRGES